MKKQTAPSSRTSRLILALLIIILGIVLCVRVTGYYSALEEQRLFQRVDFLRTQSERTTDPSEKKRLYGEMIAATENTTSYALGELRGFALYLSAAAGPEEKGALLDQLIKEFSSHPSPYMHDYVLWAKNQKTHKLDDAARLEAYEKIIDEYKNDDKEFTAKTMTWLVGKILNILEKAPERCSRYDDLVVALTGSQYEKEIP